MAVHPMPATLDTPHAAAKSPPQTHSHFYGPRRTPHSYVETSLVTKLTIVIASLESKIDCGYLVLGSCANLQERSTQGWQSVEDHSALALRPVPPLP